MPPWLLPRPGPLSSGVAFVWLDRQLDMARYGPMYLRMPDIAEIVVGSIRKGRELGHYELNAYVVLENHLHLLIQPVIAPDRLLKSLEGEPFWQKESYDHWVRNRSEFEKIRAYIE